MKVALSPPTIALVVASAGVAVALLLAVVGRDSPGVGTCRAALIPAYLPPRELTALIRGPARPRMVIVNPDSGPGAGRSAAYGNAVRALRTAGVRVLGYVPTGYGSRPLDAALADVDRYRSWYGVDGIFFDEASSDAAALGYYRALGESARRGAARLVVVNPGVPPARGYFDIADVVVTFEGTYAGYGPAMQAAPEWLRQERPERVAHLVYGATRAEAMGAVAGSAAGFVYATSGAMPNPWRSLPAYLDEEEEALAACR